MEVLKMLNFLLPFLVYPSLTVTGRSVVEMPQEYWKTKIHSQSSQTNFSFASYYSNHMVLQRAPKRAVIWGYSLNIGEEIIVKVSSRKSYVTRVYMDPVHKYGVWKVKLQAESSKGPFNITAMAMSSDKTISLKDVVFGDVWLCSGQSNMVFTVSQVFNATKEMEDTSYPDIRLFTVAQISVSAPSPDIPGIWQNWSPASPFTVGGAPWIYFSAVCWLYGKALYKELGYPIGLIDTSYGGTAIEPWSSPDALAKCGLENQTQGSQEDFEIFHQNKGWRDGADGPYTSSNLWYGMVNPLTNMTIYGVIWYQGESNYKNNVHKYNCTFPAMIDDWRLKFHNGSDGETDPMFPFGFVQLAARVPNSPQPGFPEIRWHQTADYGYVPNPRMQNVFMSVAVDLSDFGSPWASVHIRDKQDVAARLTLSGLSVAYKRKGIAYQGPLPSHIQEGTNNITLLYPNKIKYNNLIGFEALCSVKKSSVTFWIDIPILSPRLDAIVFWSGVCGQGETILGIRYLWSESPCAFKTCTVYSADNPLLPGPPFIVYQTMTNIARTVHSIDWNKPVAIGG